MNEHSHSEQTFDPEVLDRLVDGELPESERREVLQSLDRQPDGWRRCALAFLEAQAWGETLQDFVRPPSESDARAAGSPAGPTPSAVAPPAAPIPGSRGAAESKSSRHGRWRSLAAMAASFLITFSLAIYAQRFLRSPPTAGPTPTARPAPAIAAAPIPTAPPGAAPAPASGAPAANAPAGDVQMVDLDLTTPDGQIQHVRVPLVASQFAPYVLPPQTPAMPDNVREALARVGGQLQVKREYWPVQYGNRQAVVPIDRIEIVPVSNRSMQ